MKLDIQVADWLPPDCVPYVLAKNPPNWVHKIKKKLDHGNYPNVPKNQRNFTDKTFFHCPAFLNMLKRTLVIPLAYDVNITIPPNGVPETTTPDDSLYQVHGHSYEQHYPYRENNIVVKFLSPAPTLLMSKKRGLFFNKKPPTAVVMQPCYHDPLPFEVICGMISIGTDMPPHINVFFKRKPVQQNYSLKSGTPIAYFVFPESSGITVKYHPERDTNKRFILNRFTLANDYIIRK